MLAARRRNPGRTATVAILIAFIAVSSASAQEIDQTVAAGSPEAWAMNYVTASTLMTGLGGVPALSAGHWAVGAELASIPRLGESQRQVGFGGQKEEDLNKSPVFGRVRGWLGLPAKFVLELGYTPEVRVSGVRPEKLVSAALGREILATGRWRIDTRIFAQRGRAQGDITCPARLAGNPDPTINPYGCAAPSRDTIRLNYQGIEATLAWQPDAGNRFYGGLGYVRTVPAVRVDARLDPGIRDRTGLRTEGHVRYASAGVVRSLDHRIDLAAELLYVPLDVRRGAGSENDPYWSIRFQIRWHGPTNP